MKSVLEIAKECGAYDKYERGELTAIELTPRALTAFAARIRAEAVEEAAKACEQERIAANAHYFAAAIRNLAQQGEAK
jgi:adenine-specific DNA methylase